MYPVDLCIIASRRPDLLSLTLSGFSSRVFSNMIIDRVFVNIDPIFGGDLEHSQCIHAVLQHFPTAKIFEPNVPNFCAAVRRVWGATEGRFVFHLEDDWVPLYSMGDELFEKFDVAGVAQVSFHTIDRRWDIRRKGNFHHSRVYRKILGVKMPTNRYFPRFSTAPSLLMGDFARACALRMIDAYDPEKQFYSGVNVSLQDYVSPYKNYIYSIDGMPVIRDLGREWSAKRGIVKHVADSKSIWFGQDV
ncbi:hypothetical protein ANOBCDAF_03732 [Pleomorphomonas sp. T1.2MG-36]|uniref:hypothetical protein n=1 Tax=Pleomorphomonas sp. T1.2MG-36 TaxID=3041167 RepID=UPI0024776C21|nr:hypothetical protein [Pleomorphomonas sp. T1.2MG-36]CAI9416484.1 hypothetical protein ANOBCDAF_03732 [Pleomorphomonas sp. T1.2MG-36]